MEPIEKILFALTLVMTILGVCFQNLCLTLGAGFGLVAVCCYVRRH